MPTRLWPLLASLAVLSFATIANAAEEPPPLPAPAPAPAPAPGPATEPAHAPTPPPPVAKDEPKEPESSATDYRVPMIATDLALMGTFTGAWTLGRADAISDGLAVGGALGSYLGFVASGALYHAAFDTRKKTGLSIVVRSLAPVVFGLTVGSAAHDSERSKCRKEGISEDQCNHDGAQTGALVGALIGMLGATVAEATILVPDGRKPPPPPKASAFSITPSLATTRGGGQVGVAGTF